MKTARHEIHKSMLASEGRGAHDGRGAQEHVGYEARAAREQAMNKTRDVEGFVRHVRHENT